MSYIPLTDEEVTQLGRRLDSLILTATSFCEMHRKLNTLRKNGSANWKLLSSPMLIKNLVIAVVIKPRKD